MLTKESFLFAHHKDLGPELITLMQLDDFNALGNQVQVLLNLPQSLCKQRGLCCKVATFKGSLSYDELLALTESDNEATREQAKAFLTLFVPVDDQERLKAEHEGFIAQIRAIHPEKENTTYFKCRFVSDEGLCQIHEDRPEGCRAYPFPHERTVFHPGCGYEETAKLHAKRVNLIKEYLELRERELAQQQKDLMG